MIEQFKEVHFDYEKQKKKYLEISSDLSQAKKQELIEEFLEKDLWPYFQLVTEILFEMASDSEDYIRLLEKVYLKVRSDMASSPFFNMLIDLGEKKKEGIKIYNKIQKESENEGLKETSGFILGGYSVKDNTTLDKLIGDRKLSYPLTSALIKAIMVKSERLFDKDKNYDLSKKEYEFLNFVSQSDDERFLRELMNLYRFLYPMDETYFYKKIKNLMGKKQSSINGMIWIFKEKLKLSNAQLLDLAELTKDCDEYAIGELMSALTYNKLEYSSEEIKQISELFIYWINKDLEFKVRFFDYSLEELSKNNLEFLDYFLNNFERVKTKKLGYIHIFPRIFERLIRHRIKESIPKLLEKGMVKDNPKLFYRLSDKIVGEIYKISDKKESFDLFLPLARKIEEMAENTDFINNNRGKFNNLVQTNNFDELVNYINGLSEQLMFRKKDYNFKEIYSTLINFKELNNLVKDKIKKFEHDKKYTSLFWLGEQKRDKELKKAYLEELNKGVSKNKKEAKRLLKSLGSEEGFWERSSEIFFTNKFLDKSEKYFPELEVLIPPRNSNIDLKIKLNNKDVYFEIKRLGKNRNLTLDNGAVVIKNKASYILKKIHSQHFSEELLKKIKSESDKTLIFAVLDLNSSTVDDYEILDALYGSSGFQWFTNKHTGETTEPKPIRKKDSLGDKNENTNILSGVIYFKTRLELKDNKPKLKLRGNIIVNPNAINKPTKDEIVELKKIIFGN